MADPITNAEERLEAAEAAREAMAEELQRARKAYVLDVFAKHNLSIEDEGDDGCVLHLRGTPVFRVAFYSKFP